MTNHTAAALMLLVLAAAPARAQTVHDVSAYFATARTTPGAATPVVEQPMLGDTTNVWGLHALYTHLKFGNLGNLSPFASISANAYGGAVYLSMLSGKLGLTATGAYLVSACPTGVNCQGNGTAGGSVLFRLLRASVGDYPGDYSSGGRVTLSLRAAGGRAFASGTDRYTSATIGAPIALSAREGSYRVVVFVTPGAAWGSLKTHVTVSTDTGLVSVPYDHDGARGMISGGLALVPRSSGIGVHAGFQKIFVDHAGSQFGVAITWNNPELGDH